MYKKFHITIVLKNSFRRPGCRLAVTSGMQCDKSKCWFHDAFTDPTVTAYDTCDKSGRRWVYGTWNMDAEDWLSTIIILLAGLWKELPVNLKKVVLKRVDRQWHAVK